MTTHNQTAYTTPDGIKNTILNDRFSFRWFTYLSTQPSMKKLILENPSIALLDQKIKWLKLARYFLGALALTTAYFLVTKTLILSAGIVLLGLLIFRLYFLEKKYMSEVGLYLIEREYGGSHAYQQETFFMICEQLASRVGIISLVDAIYSLDKIYRFAIIFAVIFVIFIWIVEIWWQQYLAIFLVFNLLYFIVNSTFFYKRFR